VFTSSLHIHTTPVFQVELEKDGWELVDMLWCHGAQNIGLFNRKFKSAKCPVWSQCTFVLDGRTDDGWTDGRTSWQ